jgi:hypothetical protein
MATGDMVGRYLIGCLLLACPPSLESEDLAVPKEYEGRPIQGVRFEPPLQPVARADLNRLVPLKPGATQRRTTGEGSAATGGSNEFGEVCTYW